MGYKTKAATFLTIAGVALASVAASAFHANHHEVVRDVRGNVVKDIRDNCVVTKAMGHDSECYDTPSFTFDQRNIYFNFDSARLTTRAKTKLDHIADNVLATGKVINATLIGYADPIGSVSYNKSLSKKRANAVKRYLARKGYLDTRVTTLVAGGETGEFSNGCSEAVTRNNISCLQPNRRVEVHFEKKD